MSPKFVTVSLLSVFTKIPAIPFVVPVAKLFFSSAKVTVAPLLLNVMSK